MPSWATDPLAISYAGLAAALLGLLVSLAQLRRTSRVAKAATAAAENATGAVQSVATVVEAVTTIGNGREAIQLLVAGEHRAACMRLSDMTAHAIRLRENSENGEDRDMLDEIVVSLGFVRNGLRRNDAEQYSVPRSVEKVEAALESLERIAARAAAETQKRAREQAGRNG